MIKCIAVDDEPLALAKISGYIARVPFLSLLGSCQDAFEAMRLISENEVDLVFIDINMPDLNGLEFVRSLSEPPLVIITTAYPEYALDGFKLNAVDYLLKPFEFQDLLRSAEKARNYSLEKRVSALTPPTLLLLSDDDRIVPPVNSMLFYEALKRNGVKASMHVFPTGDHGWGIKPEFKYIDQWKAYVLDWLEQF